MRARLLLPLVVLALASASADAMNWAGLWSTPDQRAQGLLDRGDAAAAVPLFQDPRRKAYAEIKAARYTDAAKQLQPFDDPGSEYNRGNALARAGQLNAALPAYDLALKKAPPKSALYRDAKHNRDLGAQQLKAQRQHKAGGKNGHGKSPPKNSQQGNNQQQGQSRQQGKSRQQGQNKQQGRASQQAQGPQPGQNAQQAQPAAAAHNKPDGDVDAAWAKRDAAAALGASPHDISGGTQSPRRPESEKSMSLDQWLRWIPDDPAGLLRRKFMIEHMLKQQEAQR